MEMEKTVKEVSEVTGLAVEQEQAYESLAVMLIQKDQELVPYQEGESMNPMGVARVTKDTYNKMCGRHITLTEKEVAVFVERGSLPGLCVRQLADIIHMHNSNGKAQSLSGFPMITILPFP